MTHISRRTFLQGGATLAALTTALPAGQVFAKDAAGMDAMTAILTRRSIRTYSGEPVSEAHVTALLKAAMAAPSAGNEQPWEFVVVNDKKKLAAIATINKYAGMARNAPLAILTCVNTSLEKHHGSGVLDVSAATQNILLASHFLGLGAVWTGVYPEQDRMAGFQKLFALPQHVQPLAFVVIGHPKANREQVDRFLPERIHTNTW